MLYSRDTAVWRDVPMPVDAAITRGGTTYFFKGGVFWSFDNQAMRARGGPLLTAMHWLPCLSENERQCQVGAKTEGAD